MMAEDFDVTIVFPELSSAIIGFAIRGAVGLAVYDYDLIVQHYLDEGWEREDAIEWIEFNIVGAWVGDATPVIMHSVESMT